MEQESVYDKMSGAENIVAEFLTAYEIWWNYEQPVIVKDEDGRQRTWYPDFFLSEFGTYVEVCGAERTKDYDRRRKVYHANHISIIFVQTYKEEKKWKEYLVDSLVKIQLNRMEHLFGSLVGEIFD